jgi:hypothetical protein
VGRRSTGIEYAIAAMARAVRGSCCRAAVAMTTTSSSAGTTAVVALPASRRRLTVTALLVLVVLVLPVDSATAAGCNSVVVHGGSSMIDNMGTRIGGLCWGWDLSSLPQNLSWIVHDSSRYKTPYEVTSPCENVQVRLVSQSASLRACAKAPQARC